MRTLNAICLTVKLDNTANFTLHVVRLFTFSKASSFRALNISVTHLQLVNISKLKCEPLTRMLKIKPD